MILHPFVAHFNRIVAPFEHVLALTHVVDHSRLSRAHLHCNQRPSPGVYCVLGACMHYADVTLLLHTRR